MQKHKRKMPLDVEGVKENKDAMKNLTLYFMCEPIFYIIDT